LLSYLSLLWFFWFLRPRVVWFRRPSSAPFFLLGVGLLFDRLFFLLLLYVATHNVSYVCPWPNRNESLVLFFPGSAFALPSRFCGPLCSFNSQRGGRSRAWLAVARICYLPFSVIVLMPFQLPNFGIVLRIFPWGLCFSPLPLESTFGRAERLNHRLAPLHVAHLRSLSGIAFRTSIVSLLFWPVGDSLASHHSLPCAKLTYFLLRCLAAPCSLAFLAFLHWVRFLFRRLAG